MSAEVDNFAVCANYPQMPFANKSIQYRFRYLNDKAL
jgi:hypothetical protein